MPIRYRNKSTYSTLTPSYPREKAHLLTVPLIDWSAVDRHVSLCILLCILFIGGVHSNVPYLLRMYTCTLQCTLYVSSHVSSFFKEGTWVPQSSGGTHVMRSPQHSTRGPTVGPTGMSLLSQKPPRRGGGTTYSTRFETIQSCSWKAARR